MKASQYERGTHNCLEHVFCSHKDPEIWRCERCLRCVPKPQPGEIQAIFDKEFNETDAWFRTERRKYKLYASDYAYKALWSSQCPECERFIRESASWVVELVYPHTNTTPMHPDTDDVTWVSGRYVHWDCYKEILRRRPCFYCGETPAGTIDHIVPTARGGADEPFNLVAACISCNASKGTHNQAVHILHKEIEPAINDDWLAA